MKRTIVKQSQIETEYLACPYCMGDVSKRDWGGCCGESRDHFETAYVIQNEAFLLSEIEIIPD